MIHQHPDNMEKIGSDLMEHEGDLIEVTYTDGETEHGTVWFMDENGFILEDADGNTNALNLHFVDGFEVISL